MKGIEMKIVVLAAGRGTRLGNSVPKPLTSLDDGTTILQRQISAYLRTVRIQDVYLVVGFGKEHVMEACPRAGFIYNERFAATNTAASLLEALERFDDEDVLWSNGDVVFDPSILERVMACRESCMAVNAGHVAEEEVKYTLSRDGYIAELGKHVVGGVGEALGINKIRRADLPLFKDMLRMCNDSDYFEKGLEMSMREGLRIRPIDVSDLFCVEIDFPADLKRVNHHLMSLQECERRLWHAACA